VCLKLHEVSWESHMSYPCWSWNWIIPAQLWIMKLFYIIYVILDQQ